MRAMPCMQFHSHVMNKSKRVGDNDLFAYYISNSLVHTGEEETFHRWVFVHLVKPTKNSTHQERKKKAEMKNKIVMYTLILFSCFYALSNCLTNTSRPPVPPSLPLYISSVTKVTDIIAFVRCLPAKSTILKHGSTHGG